MLKRDQSSVDYLRIKGLIDSTTCRVFVGILATIAALSLLYLSGPPKRGEEYRQYSECSKRYSDKSGCVVALPPFKNGDSSEENRVKTGSPEYKPNGFIKDKRDLNAQEGMWRATNTLAVFTLIQIFIGFGGLYLIGKTLYETRDILDEARKTTRQAALATEAADKTAQAAENAERAFLEVQCETEILGEMEIHATNELEIDANRIFSVNVYVFNYGKTPANISMIDIALVHEESQEEITHQFVVENSEYKPVLYRSKATKDIMAWPDRKSYVYEAAWLPTFPYLAEHLYGGAIDIDDTSIKEYEKHLIAIKARVEYMSAFGEEREVSQLITFRPRIPIATQIHWMPDWRMDSARGSMVSLVEDMMTETTYTDRPKFSKQESN